MKTDRKPWHYDAFKPRPQWSRDLGRYFAMKRQIDNDIRKLAERTGARR